MCIPSHPLPSPRDALCAVSQATKEDELKKKNKPKKDLLGRQHSGSPKQVCPCDRGCMAVWLHGVSQDYKWRAGPCEGG